VVKRKPDDSGLRMKLLDSARCFDPVQLGHAQVANHDVGSKQCRKPYRLIAVLSLMLPLWIGSGARIKLGQNEDHSASRNCPSEKSNINE
jgi:hypothetical protein